MEGRRSAPEATVLHPQGRRPRPLAPNWSAEHFNPLPPRGGRPVSSKELWPIMYYFNPLPPRGGRPTTSTGAVRTKEFQSTPSAWRETIVRIGGRQPRRGFQSTPSAWRETFDHYTTPDRILHFNPLPPRGGRRWVRGGSPAPTGISIHSLRVEGDAARRSSTGRSMLFQSTPSAWRETPRFCAGGMGKIFQSTPSAWRETLKPGQAAQRGEHFNPLPPRGGRRSL